MIKTKTVSRALTILAAVAAFAGTALAESVLNFTPKGPARIAITNTTAYTADVKFTLYDKEGTVVSSNLTNNPISYRVPPMGQLDRMVAEIFRMKSGMETGGWIQATSAVNGLQGYYFSNDFSGAQSSSPFQIQTIPHIVPGATEVLVTNPGSQNAEVTVSFFDESGKLLGVPLPVQLPPHAQVPVSGNGATARIEARTGASVLAAAIIEESATRRILIPGQTDRSGQWVVPNFRNAGGNVSSYLALATPSAPGPATVTVTFFNNAGESPYGPQVITIPALGSRRLYWSTIAAGLPISPDGDGWLSVQSRQPLVGIAFVKEGSSTSAVPLQFTGAERTLFSRVATQGMPGELIVVSPNEGNANVTVTFTRPDGSTAFQTQPRSLQPRSKTSIPLADLIPAEARFDSGFATIRSSLPIYAMELIGAGQGSVTPQRFSSSFAPGPVTATTVKVALKDGGDLRPGALLKVTAEGGTLKDPTLWVGDKWIQLQADVPGTEFSAELPKQGMEPGPITAKVRAGGVESVSDLGFYSSPEFQLTPDAPILRGYARFQKLDVTDNGLDTAQPYMVPIRFARVEVMDNATSKIVAVTETDAMGFFKTNVPAGTLTVTVWSRLYSQDLRVLNNAANNALYSISRPDIVASTSMDTEIELVDESRSAGAFNILDTLQKGNALLAAVVPGFVPPPLTIYWNEKNNDAVLARLTNGAVRTTFFSPINNAAYIVGDRATDSDEYDDAVILHEYAHMIAAKFSRDDSPGGTHLMGDLLDPRVAWSEGWANFFSSVARGSSLYRDSKAGTNLLRFDLEDNVPAGDRPGYSSEASVHGLLWDLIDENADNGDAGQFSFASLWQAFTDLRSERYVYLPYFMERFLTRNPEFRDAMRTLALIRQLDFQPDGRPSVSNPFPRTIAVGETRSNNQVDSFTTKRTNLANSAHFYSLSVTSAGAITISLGIDNAGPASNLNFADLDLYLYDSTGKSIIARSDGAQNGRGEQINMYLAAGNYFVEVRSFYTLEQTNAIVFNSGTYTLKVAKF